MDPQLLQQMSDPAAALRADAHSGGKEERARDPTAHTEIKLEQASFSPIHPSPDSELYWSPWLYSDIVIPDHLSGSSALTCSLPPFPHCPGPLLASDPPPVRRPEMSFAFSQEHPQLAAIYQAVQAVGTPNYRGARQPVPHNLNIQASRDRSHLFPDASLVEMLEFGFPIGYTAPHPPTLRARAPPRPKVDQDSSGTARGDHHPPLLPVRPAQLPSCCMGTVPAHASRHQPQQNHATPAHHCFSKW